MWPGLFAGLSLEGTVLIERKDANRDFYGSPVPARDILGGRVPPPEVASRLYEIIEAAEGLDETGDEGHDEYEPGAKPTRKRQDKGKARAKPLTKKGKKPHMPTPHSDSEDVTAGHMSMSLLQMIFFVSYLLCCFLDKMSLKTLQKSKKPINHYPPIDEILGLSIPSHRSKCLPALRYVCFYLLFLSTLLMYKVYTGQSP